MMRCGRALPLRRTPTTPWNVVREVITREGLAAPASITTECHLEEITLTCPTMPLFSQYHYERTKSNKPSGASLAWQWMRRPYYRPIGQQVHIGGNTSLLSLLLLLSYRQSQPSSPLRSSCSFPGTNANDVTASRANCGGPTVVHSP